MSDSNNVGQKFRPVMPEFWISVAEKAIYSRKLQAYPKATFYAFNLSRIYVQLTAKSN